MNKTVAGVQTLYTEDDLSSRLWSLSLQGKSLRAIAQEEFEGKITHADVQRGLKGDFPKTARKRAAMKLISLVETEPCLDCGEVHKIEGVCIKKLPPNKEVRIVNRYRPRVYKHWRDMPQWAVRWMLDNREPLA